MWYTNDVWTNNSTENQYSPHCHRSNNKDKIWIDILKQSHIIYFQFSKASLRFTTFSSKKSISIYKMHALIFDIVLEPVETHKIDPIYVWLQIYLIEYILIDAFRWISKNMCGSIGYFKWNVWKYGKMSSNNNFNAKLNA